MMVTKFHISYLIILTLKILIGKCINSVPKNDSYHRLGTRSLSNYDNYENSYHNLVTYVEIKNNFDIFPFEKNENRKRDDFKKIADFNEIAIDHKEKFIYVGARDYLIKFSYENDSLQIKNYDSDIIAWEANIDAITDCKKAASLDKYCHNYVRLISIQDKKLLACANYANRPVCTWRSKLDLSNVLDQFDGMGKIGSAPDSSLTYLQTKNGDFYFATSIDYSEQGMRPDYLIERSLGSSIQLRTDQYNSNWLYEPIFVGSIEIGNYVYFFIRETAIESLNCGEKIYSRVVRLCKYDQGLENVMIWKHFEKARLNCSIPSHHKNNADGSNSYFKTENEYPFYFDEIQNIYFDKQKNLIYALFSQPFNGIKSSAVCVYDIKSIENAFNGPFKYQKTQSSIWEPFYDNYSPKCEPNMMSSSPPNKYQLKHFSIQPLFQKPILVLPNRRITKLVVDSVLTKHQNNIEILFLATETNTILKYMLLNVEMASSSTSNINPSVCHLEELELFESKTKQSNLINNLMILENYLDEDYSKSKSLLIASSVSFIKIPVANCKAQTNYFSCLSLMDPYCVWDSKVQKCLLIFNTYEIQKSSQSNNNNNNRLSSHLHQHSINQCPSTNIPVDGEFSEWSTWTTCTLAKSSGEKCKCRMRVCNSPEPRNGGKNCDESQSIEIKDCQVDGGWTSWSAWSACKQSSCADSQPSIRTRTRTCTNPEPKNNGRLCVGLDQEEEICTQEMINPCGGLQHSNSNHQWMSWGSWEECSKPCGEGFQMRRRLCNGKNCFGSNQEWRVCNSEPCKEKNENLIKEWETVEIDYEMKQKLERRVKFMCKYDPNYLLDSNSFLELNSTFEYRICDLNNNNDQCRNIDQSKEVLGHYSQWSEWSKCSKNCMENEKQHRTRKCSISHSCFGPDKEEKDCECSNNINKLNLHHNKYLEFSWSCWSSFTPCSVKCGKGIQKRTRQCLSSDPLNCLGPKEQIESCFGTNCSFYDTLAHSFTNNSHGIKNGFNLIHLILISILAFFLGSSSVLMLVFINSKRNKKNKKSSLFCSCCCTSSSKLNKSSSKNNIKLHNTSANSNDKQFFSLDHNSLESDTANTEIMINNNSDSSKFSDNSSSNSTTHSAVHQNHLHSKEYFTIGGATNRFIDPTNLSLLNNIEDTEEDLNNILGINSSNTLNSKKMKSNGLLKTSQNTNNKNFDLPTKSFNTYTNQQTTNSILNNKNSSSIKALGNNSNYSNSTTNSNNTLRYSNYFNQTGSIRSNLNNSNNKQRQPVSSLMRTNLDQEL